MSRGEDRSQNYTFAFVDDEVDRIRDTGAWALRRYQNELDVSDAFVVWIHLFKLLRYQLYTRCRCVSTRPSQGPITGKSTGPLKTCTQRQKWTEINWTEISAQFNCVESVLSRVVTHCTARGERSKCRPLPEVKKSTECGVIGPYDICVLAWLNRWHACNNSSFVLYS